MDAEAFEEAAARRGRHLAAYRAAVDLYAGELLPEDHYETWAENRREGLRRTHLSLLLEMAGLHEERDDYGPAIEAPHKALAEEPALQAAHARLARLYALRGRRSEAPIRLREGPRRGLAG